MKKLTDVCNIIYGYAFDSKRFNTSKGIPVIRIRDVVRGYTETFTDEDVSEEYYIENNDLLVGMDGEFNIGSWKGGHALLNQRVCKLVPGKSVSNRYLYHFMPHVLKEIEENTSFVTVKHLSAKHLNSIEFPDISLPEQQKIAAHLDSIQSAIDNKKQQLQQLDELVKSKFVEMFGENPVESGKWKVETLGDVCSSIVRGPFGSALKKEFFVPKSNDTVKVYEQKHAIQKSADIGTYYVTQEKYEELKRFECKPGDFLMSCSGTMGEFYRLPEGCEKGIINQALCKFTLNEKMEPLFFYEWMKHSIHNLETRGSGIKNVAAVSFVKQMPMILPSKEIQNEYVSYVQKIDSAKSIIKTQLVDFQELLDSKMDEYFGE